MLICFPIKISPSMLMNVAMGEHFAFDNQIFDVAKFTLLTPLSLLISCKLSFLIVGLKISSLYFCIEIS
jgi:hypothetical protein